MVFQVSFLIFTRFSLSSIILQVSVTIERKTVPQEIDSFWDDKHDRTRGQTSVLIKWRIKQNVERNMDKRNGIRKKKKEKRKSRKWGRSGGKREEGARQDLAVWFRIKYYDKNVAWITWKYAYAQYAVSLYRFCRMAHCVVLCSHVACFPNVTITVRPHSRIATCFVQRVCAYSKPVPKYPSILRPGHKISLRLHFVYYTRINTWYVCK